MSLGRSPGPEGPPAGGEHGVGTGSQDPVGGSRWDPRARAQVPPPLGWTRRVCPPRGQRAVGVAAIRPARAQVPPALCWHSRAPQAERRGSGPSPRYPDERSARSPTSQANQVAPSRLQQGVDAAPALQGGVQNLESPALWHTEARRAAVLSQGVWRVEWGVAPRHPHERGAGPRAPGGGAQAPLRLTGRRPQACRGEPPFGDIGGASQTPGRWVGSRPSARMNGA